MARIPLGFIELSEVFVPCFPEPLVAETVSEP
jgi:hypothetical protein